MLFDDGIIYAKQLDQDVPYDELEERLEKHRLCSVDMDWVAQWLHQANHNIAVGAICGRTFIEVAGGIVAYQVQASRSLEPIFFPDGVIPAGKRIIVSPTELGDGATEAD